MNIPRTYSYKPFLWFATLSALALVPTSQTLAQGVTHLQAIQHVNDPYLYGSQANKETDNSLNGCPHIASTDGRYVVFESEASNLVADDTNGSSDIFIRDTVDNTITRVSLHNDGSQLDRASRDPCMSSDGRYVVFYTAAAATTDLHHDFFDVYLRDLTNGTTTLVSTPTNCTVCNGQAQFGVISGDGSTVAFRAFSANLNPRDPGSEYQIYRYEVATGALTLLSVNASGDAGDGRSNYPAINGDGTLIAFESDASDLVASDSNAARDVFLWDSGNLTLVSQTAAGVQGDDDSSKPNLADDGSRLAFESEATNLVAGDTNGVSDIFVADIASGNLATVSVTPAGGAFPHPADAAVLSDNGNRVSFRVSPIAATPSPSTLTTSLMTPKGVTYPPNSTGSYLYVRNLNAGTTLPRLTAEDDKYHWGRLDGAGQRVDFTSAKSNYVNADTNGTRDVFRLDVQSGNVMRLNELAAGTQFASTPNGEVSDTETSGNAMSADGRYVVFASTASNLVAVTGDIPAAEYTQIYLFDRQTQTTELISRSLNATADAAHSSSPSLSADGRYVVFESERADLVAGDTNGESDVFVFDRDTDTMTRASVDASGNEFNDRSSDPLISADGQHVLFSQAGHLFVYAMGGGAIEQIDVAGDGASGNSSAFDASLSGDGRYVVFASYADNLVPNDNNRYEDIFWRDRDTRTTLRISRANGGGDPDGSSSVPSISADGSVVVFQSTADNLLNSALTQLYKNHWFAYEIQTDRTTLISQSTGGSESDGNASGYAQLSADGRFVVFSNNGNNLVADDTNSQNDAFLHDRLEGWTRRISLDSNDTEGEERAEPAGLSADARQVFFTSSSRNWQLDAGELSSYLYGNEGFVAMLDGVVENTQTTIVETAPLTALVNEYLPITVIVSGDIFAPQDGSVRITADSGETCTVTARAPVPGSVDSVQFVCSLAFSSAGTVNVTARFQSSDTHRISLSTVQVAIMPATVEVFSNGFE